MRGSAGGAGYSGRVLDPRLLYTFDPDLWESVRGTRPALIHLLDGYIDAGSVTHATGRYLLEACEHEVLAEFDHDQLHDYRSRRPQMVFDTNQWVGMTDYALVIHRLLDATGKPFLLFTGPEPDTQWNRTAAAVLGIAEELDVSSLITVSGVPMAVPHTRPTLVTAHATEPETVSGNPMWIDRVQIPGSFSHVLEYRAGQAGRLGQGFVAHVPHYLAQAGFPQATQAVIGAAREGRRPGDPDGRTVRAVGSQSRLDRFRDRRGRRLPRRGAGPGGAVRPAQQQRGGFRAQRRGTRRGRRAVPRRAGPAVGLPAVAGAGDRRRTDRDPRPSPIG